MDHPARGFQETRLSNVMPASLFSTMSRKRRRRSSSDSPLCIQPDESWSTREPGHLRKHFISEAIKCYHVLAARAAIIMAWNLAYDHLLKWILVDPKRLAAFNASIPPVMGPKRTLVVKAGDDFEEFKEAKLLDVCKHASLFSGNTKHVLEIQLKNAILPPTPRLLITLRRRLMTRSRAS
jgi:hypothetical protein